MHPVIEFSLMTPLVQVSKSQLTIYELGTICKCAKLKLMADLHGDTVHWATLDQEIQRVTLKRKLYMETGIFHSATEVSA